jgi:hypothetical protein
MAAEVDALFEEEFIGVTFVVLDVFAVVVDFAAGLVVFTGSFLVDVCAFAMLPINRSAKTGIKYFFIIIIFR